MASDSERAPMAYSSLLRQLDAVHAGPEARCQLACYVTGSPKLMRSFRLCNRLHQPPSYRRGCSCMWPATVIARHRRTARSSGSWTLSTPIFPEAMPARLIHGRLAQAYAFLPLVQPPARPCINHHPIDGDICGCMWPASERVPMAYTSLLRQLEAALDDPEAMPSAGLIRSRLAQACVPSACATACPPICINHHPAIDGDAAACGQRQ